MNATKLLLTACMLAPSPVAFADPTEHPADRNAPVLMAAADAFVAPIHSTGRFTVETRGTSPGVAEALPDVPQARPFSARGVASPQLLLHMPADKARFGVVSGALPDDAGVSLLQASPLAGAARRVGAQRFNTDDGSSIDAFAICYRLSKRASMQVIPGDPAPVKIPVSTMANNMGVTVGMVLRLSKTR